MRPHWMAWLGIWMALVRPCPAAKAPCADAANPVETSACLAATVERLQRRVDGAEHQVMLGLRRVPPADDANPPTGMAAPSVRFEAAATAWARFRDAECEAQAALFAQGTIEGIVRLVCQSNLATARLRELKQAYHDILRRP